MPVYLDTGTVRVDGAAATVRGKRWAMESIEAVNAVPASGALWPFVVVLFVAPVIALPVASSWISKGRSEITPLIAMAVSAMAVFFAIFRLLTLTDRYDVVVRVKGAERSVFSSEDHELVISIVAAIQRAKKGEAPNVIPLRASNS